MPEHAAHPAPTARGVLLVMVFALMGGYADAGSFVLVSSFTGHVTGNSILFMVDVARHDWTGVGRCATAVVAFLGGTMIGNRFRGGTTPAANARRLTRSLLIEIALFAAAVSALMVFPRGGHIAFVVCLCAGLGVQNGTLQKLGMLSVHTTYLTGMSTSLADQFEKPHIGDRQTVKRKIFAGLIASFLLGAACGAILCVRYGVAGFCWLFVPAVAALAINVCFGRNEAVAIRSAP